MKLPRRKFLHLAAGGGALSVVSRVAWVQAYPSRQITMIVPFAAGGQRDVIGRIMAERMRTPLGQPVVIENIGGAGGSIARSGDARAGLIHSRTFTGTSSSYACAGLGTTCHG